MRRRNLILRNDRWHGARPEFLGQMPTEMISSTARTGMVASRSNEITA
jgi:hypothetical protein